MRLLISIAFFLVGSVSCTAKTVRALFIGNSYTYTNNIPEMIHQLAVAEGDTLLYASSAPGGYKLQQHLTNATTLSLIGEGSWDYVILQEQSQLPSFPDAEVIEHVYPYAKGLDSIIKEKNPCAKTLFYVTWGRKNGDADNCPFFPPLCTYEGMDSLLQLRYTYMAEVNGAVIAPVAMVWRKLRLENPEIDLYQADESHPSLAGSFTSACTFYTILFHKNPELSGYNASLSPAVAAVIKNKAMQVAFDSLEYWYRFQPMAEAQFEYTVSSALVSFENTSTGAESYLWNFGDGATSAEPDPVHTYSAEGTYEVTLVANKCTDADTFTSNITISSLSTNEVADATEHALLFPSPVHDHFNITYEEGIYGIRIYDMSGTKVLDRDLSGQKTVKMECKNFKSGIYAYQVKGKEGSCYGRFLKI